MSKKIKKYMLLKDLPFAKAGDIVELEKIVNSKGCISITMIIVKAQYGILNFFCRIPVSEMKNWVKKIK